MRGDERLEKREGKQMSEEERKKKMERPKQYKKWINIAASLKNVISRKT